MSEGKSLVAIVVWLAILVLIVLTLIGNAHAFTTEASYFTYASCLREGTSGIMANGERLKDDGEYTCASWDFPLNLPVVVSCGKNSIVCIVKDRGPSKKLYKRGRRLDLNAAAFKALSGGKLDCGLLQVTVERSA